MALKEFMSESEKTILEWRVEALAARPPPTKQIIEKRKSDSIASNTLEAAVRATNDIASQFQKPSWKKIRS